MPISKPRTRPAGLVIVAAVLAAIASTAYGQLPPAPTPVPGSLLERPELRIGDPVAESAPELPSSPSSPLSPSSPSGAQAQAKPQRTSFGTAFRVDKAGHLVTNRHVVDGCSAIGIVTGDKAVGGLQLVAIDPQHDLALLAGPPASVAASLRASDEPIQGEDALVYGFPLPGMLASSGQLGAGMVTALTGLRNDPYKLQVDVPLQPGNSGGPLVDRRGQVIGVVFGKLNALRLAQITGDIAQNVNFAVRLAPLKHMLQTNGVRFTVGAADRPPLSNQQIAEQARSWTIPIACQRTGPLR